MSTKYTVIAMCKSRFDMFKILIFVGAQFNHCCPVKYQTAQDAVCARSQNSLQIRLQELCAQIDCLRLNGSVDNDLP